ncbi:hypothetical protein JW916_03370 [Candidatus Sumerlaeota bacterium]|nr:hypothetical protein [Candidatus Sumerlaeota bacterium]
MTDPDKTSESTACERRPSPRRVRTSRLVVSGLLAAALTAWMVAGALRVKTDRTFLASLQPVEEGDFFKSRDAYIGWAKPAGPGLWLDPGARGQISFLIYADPGEKVVASLRVRNDPTIRTKVVLQPADQAYRFLDVPEATTEKPVVPLRYDLTSALAGAHYFYFIVDSRREADGESEGTVRAVESLKFDFFGSAPRPVRIASCLFFSGVCFLAWWTLFGWIVPAAVEGIRVPVESLFRSRRSAAFRRAVLGAILVIALGASWKVVAAPVWRLPKLHDDRWALSNARLLAIRRFHTDDLFFRSRIRPGLLALMLPLQTAVRQDLATTSYAPSDFRERTFYVFERRDETWGTRMYAEASVLGMLFALLALGLTARLALRFQGRGAGPLRAALVLLFAAWFLRRILGTSLVSPISLAATWLFLVAPMVAFALAARNPRRRTPWAFAGVLTGLAGLFSESALTVLLPIALYQLQLYGARPRHRFAMRNAVVVFWIAAAALPTVYYGLVIDGGFGEIAGSFAGHLKSSAFLENYEETSVRGAARALWAAFGVGLPFALAGMILQLRPGGRVPGATGFFLLWLLGCLTVFTLPYLYPRFLIYTIPPLAWFAAEALVWSLGSWRRTGA